MIDIIDIPTTIENPTERTINSIGDVGSLNIAVNPTIEKNKGIR